MIRMGLLWAATDNCFTIPFDSQLAEKRLTSDVAWRFGKRAECDGILEDSAGDISLTDPVPCCSRLGWRWIAGHRSRTWWGDRQKYCGIEIQMPPKRILIWTHQWPYNSLGSDIVLGQAPALIDILIRTETLTCFLAFMIAYTSMRKMVGLHTNFKHIRLSKQMEKR